MDIPEDLEDAVGAFVDGKPIVCGGIFTANCYNYDFDSQEWESSSPMDAKIKGASSNMVDRSTWWVAGGSDLSGSLSTSVLYKNGSWSEGPRLPFATSNHCMVQVNSTHFLLLGGDGQSEAWFMNWPDQKWTQTTNMAGGRTGAACGKAGGDKVVVGGGGFFDDPRSEIFDTRTQTWSPLESVPGGGNIFMYFSDTVQVDDSFLVVGGYERPVGHLKDYTGRIYRFDLETLQWRLRTETLATPREGHVVISIPQGILNC